MKSIEPFQIVLRLQVRPRTNKSSLLNKNLRKICKKFRVLWSKRKRISIRLWKTRFVKSEMEMGMNSLLILTIKSLKNSKNSKEIKKQIHSSYLIFEKRKNLRLIFKEINQYLYLIKTFFVNNSSHILHKKENSLSPFWETIIFPAEKTSLKRLKNYILLST